MRSGLSSKQDLDQGPPDPWTCCSGPWWHWPGQRCGPSPPTIRKPCHLGFKYSTKGSPTNCINCDRTVPDCHCTHANAIVPALSLGLPRLDTHAMTHRPPAQAMAPLDFVGNHPDLEQTFVRVAGYRRERPERGPFFPLPSNLISSTSPGPGVPQTLCAHCWIHAPSWSPVDSWG